MGIIDRYLQRRGFIKAEDVTQKSAGFMELEVGQYPAGRVELDTGVAYRDFNDAFRQLPWLYAAETAVAVAAMKAQLKVYHERRKKNGEIEKIEAQSEPINELLARPNEFWSYREFMQTTVINLMSTGNHYWNLVGTSDREPVEISLQNPPVELWWVKPESITILAGDHGEVAGYEYSGPTGKTRKLAPSEVIHFRLVNPDSYFLGLGVVAPAKTAAMLEFNAQAYNRAFLENDGTPPFLFTNGPQEPEQRKRFWAAWDERHKGPKKANRAGMIWGGMDVKPLGTTPKDAQYIEMRKMNREEILACAGVPPSIVGLLEYANYSNMEIQQRKFWEDTVIPILNIIADKLTLNLGPHFGDDLVFEFDYSGVKALQENEEGKARTASILIQNGIKTPNQIIQELYRGEGYKGGDQYYMSMAMIPVGSTAGEWWEQDSAKQRASMRLARAERKRDGRASFWRDNEERAKAYWLAFERRVSAKERAMAPEVEAFLLRQAKNVAKEIAKYHHLADVKISNVFDVEAEVKAYEKKFEPRYRDAFEKAEAAGEAATTGKLYSLDDESGAKDLAITPEQLAKLRAQIEKSAKFFNETTWNAIKDGLFDGEAENMTTAEVAQAIRDHLESLSPGRSRRIARTEMARTENWGGLEGYRQNEAVTGKGWMCSFLEDSRDAHMAADGQEVGIDEDFIVGGERLAYPGDDRGSASNTIECKCATYPVVGGTE